MSEINFSFYYDYEQVIFYNKKFKQVRQKIGYGYMVMKHMRQTKINLILYSAY